jgi:N-acyl homoserine lactone hydrolase
MKLYLLRLADMGGAPAAGYLVQTDDGTNVLIDSGFPREMVGSSDGPTIAEDQFVVNQLAQIGVTPDDIHYLVVTHLDVDHAGAHDEFPGAELVIQRRHHEARESPRFDLIRAHWDAPGLRYRLVDGDTELVPGVELVETSGHVPGHQSVLVRLPETGPVILAIDAIPHGDLLDPDTRAITEYDEEEEGVRDSTRKLVELAHRENAALIVRGHDGPQWEALRTLPGFYS